MKIESVLRSINRRIKDYVDVFGIDSVEYAWARNLFYQATDIANAPIGKMSGGAIQFSRSKSTMQEIWENPVLEENIRQIWEIMKNRGTVKQIIENEYMDMPGTKEWMEENGFTISDIMNDSETMGDIREESHIRADRAYNDDDIYADVNKELDNSDDNEDIADLAEIIGRFHDEGKGAEKDRKWHDIQRMWGDYQYRKEREMSMRAAETEPE